MRRSAARRYIPRDLRVAILAAQFHGSVTRALVAGATGVLRRAGVRAERIQIVAVPGAFELPVAAARLARARAHPDAIIALGALIEGETVHYQVIAHAVANGLTQLSVMTGIPVTFGVIVAPTLAHAKARAGGRMGNRGVEAAQAALAVLRSTSS